MKFLIERKRVPAHKISTIYNWIDLTPYKDLEKTGRFRKRYKLENKFIFLFAGVMGPSQYLDLIIRAARECKQIKDICFLLVGDGSEKERLKKMAEDYGVHILLEPHGPVTDSIKGLQDVFDRLGNPGSLGVNLDTGNSWLGGADPVEMAKVFKDKIHHVHWKDLGAEWEPKRGTVFGCGFSTIALGDGVIDIKGVCEVLKDADIESSTLEIIGSEDILKKSVKYLKENGL